MVESNSQTTDVKENKTPKGKQIEVYSDGRFGMYKIKFTSGGELPKSLDGLFSTTVLAQNAIDVYLSQKVK